MQVGIAACRARYCARIRADAVRRIRPFRTWQETGTRRAIASSVPVLGRRPRARRRARAALLRCSITAFYAMQ